jgi:16S rRNA (adenine1518-N6/adenine1519-N6)-dimethyltransferase
MAAGISARAALAKHGFLFSHSLGQNFILDDSLLARIADAAGVGADCVLEIGAGAGTLTRTLCERGARVLALEIDRSLEPVLSDVLAGCGAVVEFADVLKCDLPALTDAAFCGAPFDVIANLPYYITADILVMLVRLRLPIRRMTVMVQREAGERILASPGDKNWCALAATLRYYGEPAALFPLMPGAFTPRPHVESLLMRIDAHPERLSAEDEAFLLRVIGAAFAMRRKTLVNNLTRAFLISRERAQALVESLGLDARIRGEALEMEQLVRLSAELKSLLQG